jgi:two-component system CheB/CheR fusion protein
VKTSAARSFPLGRSDVVHGWGDLAEAPATPRQCRRALVVDDNVDGASVLAEALRTRGHEVHVAHDGRSALQQAIQYTPDVVLLDIGLPDLDGYEVASRMRREPGLLTTKVIAVTGFGREQHPGRSAEAGFAFHMVKPIDLAQLDAVLAAWQEDAEEREPKPTAEPA